MEREELTADNALLRRCIDGLADLLVLQLTWGRGYPSEIVASLLVSLLDLLGLDLVCLHLRRV